ncbi:MAG TPA: hypothetical protein VF471_10815 [Pseudoxanthomonas sp.]
MQPKGMGCRFNPFPFSAGFDRHTEKSHAFPIQNEVFARGLGFDVVAVCLRAHWPAATARSSPTPDSSCRYTGTGSATTASLTPDEKDESMEVKMPSILRAGNLFNISSSRKPT